ncbi:sulfate adenylyltransferase [Heterostelium album PN500]|uniref:Sulfate adenylyltransferase n=1 Tax=Heterostelium pallidum (strain ATCC 26659 / Pp 5 / PN500) TaxID=670386 RepID=D3B714_HETP5|nr:sulfate adenylyltransferase [Heterostelium album PN500]EFA82557.1 sulfate adenylyltransferase [Heterostelium album PN500]|eukprot:XP_020434674.1 sulfate adenylyltransferase [Heterostelium album PN500]
MCDEYKVEHEKSSVHVCKMGGHDSRLNIHKIKSIMIPIRFESLDEAEQKCPGSVPHGGRLVDLLLKGDDLVELKKRSLSLPSLVLTRRHQCDIELILNGGFSPLTSFMDEPTYNRVVEEMRLPSGILFPMPITLDVNQEFVDIINGLNVKDIALRDEEGNLIAVMNVSSIFKANKEKECRLSMGSVDPYHPGVDQILKSKEYYIAGKLEGAQLPVHYDYNSLRRTPLEVRTMLAERGWTNVIAFQTRNPMHRAHRELTVRAAELNPGCKLLIHPVVGMTKPGDIDYHTRVKCYQSIMGSYPEGLAELSLLPLAMRMGGPREVVWHAIIRKNFGATHFIVGRDHAGPGEDKSGKPFYEPYEAQENALKYESELGVKILPFQMMVYVEAEDKYYPVDQVPQGAKTSNISGTTLRHLLRTGGEIPNWFTYESVVRILRQSCPPRVKQGFTVFFTGFSGSGKSTIANALHEALLAANERSITLLDGDVVRTFLSSELGFSKEHRDLNIKRIGFVASEINKAGGIAICAPIAPYEVARKFARDLVNNNQGGFVEVHISTPIEVCEKRDRKGLYAKVRAGQLKGFTGIDDPYEAPVNPELKIDTTDTTVSESVKQILSFLQKEGYIQ